VDLIPYNNIGEGSFKQSNKDSIAAFQKHMRWVTVPVTVTVTVTVKIYMYAIIYAQEIAEMMHTHEFPVCKYE
jgi:uncharacterized membrane protein YqhA